MQSKYQVRVSSSHDRVLLGPGGLSAGQHAQHAKASQHDGRTALFKRHRPRTCRYSICECPYVLSTSRACLLKHGVRKSMAGIALSSKRLKEGNAEVCRRFPSRGGKTIPKRQVKLAVLHRKAAGDSTRFSRQLGLGTGMCMFPGVDDSRFSDIERASAG